MVSTATTSRTQLSRVTLIGERRRADLVLPSDTAIGQLLPDILRLLDDRAATRPTTRQLITSDGSALPHDATLSSAGVPDGAVLRLVRTHAAPPAPVVHDVTDQVADDLDLRAWRWRPAARRASGIRPRNFSAATRSRATPSYRVAAHAASRPATATGPPRARASASSQPRHSTARHSQREPHDPHRGGATRLAMKREAA